MGEFERRRRQQLTWLLGTASLVALLAGLAGGSQGWAWPGAHEMSPSLLWDIRLPRSLGAWLVGALFGLAGALAQGLFRNPLADPYLLGSAAGASLAVSLTLGAGSLAGWGAEAFASHLAGHWGLTGAAFVGAMVGVSLTLLLARGAEASTRLLLAGVIVGVVLGALTDLVTTLSPQALRGRQAFLLGSTAFIGWEGVALLALALGVCAPLARRASRVLDALVLGADTARSLGLSLARWRLALVALMALATGAAVAQAGMVAFIGLVAPHLVARIVPTVHGHRLLASAAMGGVLMLASDVAARTLLAPEELPVGVLTAVLGGSYLLALLWRRGPRGVGA